VEEKLSGPVQLYTALLTAGVDNDSVLPTQTGELALTAGVLGVGLTVTVYRNGSPAQLLLVGTIVYTTVTAALVLLLSTSLICPSVKPEAAAFVIPGIVPRDQLYKVPGRFPVISYTSAVPVQADPLLTLLIAGFGVTLTVIGERLPGQLLMIERT